MVARGALVVVAVWTSVARAQPKPPPNPPLVGATELVKLTPANGFVDDGIALDGDRLAYVVSDGAGKTELHVLALGTKVEQVVELSAVAQHPITLALVGRQVLVTDARDDDKQVAALVELDKPRAGRAVYKLAPATNVTLITRDGRPRLAVHRVATTKTGTRHDVELLAIESGRRIGAARSLELDGSGTHKPLELRVNHWSDGWTRAHGIKGGEWSKKDDARSPDTEVTYDVLLGKIVANTPIADLFEQRRRFQSLADAGGVLDFVRISGTDPRVQLWKDGTSRFVELDQPIGTYDPQSLHGTVRRDGTAWLVLKVDPINPEAMARKKSDAEYLDIFHVTADGKGTRRARILAAGARYRVGLAGDKLWLLERSAGHDRGGKTLSIIRWP